MSGPQETRRQAARDVLGIAFLHLGWVPAPRYALRRWLVLRRLAKEKPARLLEIGPGIGALLYELSAEGWDCTGVEHSPIAAAKARQALVNSPGVRIVDSLPDAAQFDCLMAFEVLEHLEDDKTALESWLRCIRPGGLVLLSMPAHPHLWSHTDVLAGHCRRYTRGQMVELVSSAGCRVEHLSCYGWPLSNLTTWVRARRDNRKQDNASDNTVQQQNERTFASGIERQTELRLYPLLKGPLGTMALFTSFLLQDLALNKDWGTGYLVIARKM